jgi:hypothetical protein
MSYKPDESVLMAYLYDELDGEERLRVEKYLQENPDALKEIAALEHLRKMLSTVEDKEVIAPPIVMDDGKQRYFWNTVYFKTVTSIAASLLILILVGKLTGMQMGYSNNEFRLSFGPEAQKPAGETQPLLTPEQVQQMINASLTNNNEVVQASLNESQKRLDESISKNLAMNSSKINNLMQQASVASQNDIRQYVASLQSENQQVVKDYFQLTSNEQQKYIEGLLVDFSKYMQQQRSNDLNVLQTRLSSIEQNTTVFKQETEQILASIISNNPTSNTSKSY